MHYIIEKCISCIRMAIACIKRQEFVLDEKNFQHMITGVEVSLVSYIILFPLLLSFLTITGSVYMCNSNKIQISPSYIHCCRQLVHFNQSPSRSVVLLQYI